MWMQSSQESALHGLSINLTCKNTIDDTLWNANLIFERGLCFMIIDPGKWREICAQLFTTVGVPKEDACVIADAAVSADIRGMASHGTARLTVYRKRIQQGLINPKPQIRIVNDCPTLVHLDGDNGMGQVVASKAAEIAGERAKKYGCCAVATYHSNHMALLSYYSLKLLDQGLISYIMCNTPPFVAASGSIEPAVGTNPLCWAIPGRQFPIVLDMAISPARGKIKNAAAAQQPIPGDWALDQNGNPTTDPKAALAGVLLPIAGHKGYGMGLVVEAFSGLMTGGVYGKNWTHPLDDYEHVPNCGNFIMALDPSKIMPQEEFLNRVDDYTNMIKSSKKKDPNSEIIFPGEIECRREAKVRQEGLEISDKMYQEFCQLIEG